MFTVLINNIVIQGPLPINSLQLNQSTIIFQLTTLITFVQPHNIFYKTSSLLNFFFHDSKQSNYINSGLNKFYSPQQMPWVPNLILISTLNKSQKINSTPTQIANNFSKKNNFSIIIIFAEAIEYIKKQNYDVKQQYFLKQIFINISQLSYRYDNSNANLIKMNTKQFNFYLELYLFLQKPQFKITYRS
eukprot:EC097005.1.p1 GENE.EC097005.1~~EC097005.1.p1  ORF type:complete len:189 (-),score=14.79 EC097005.1:125-691(-)